jgi:superfamily II DNA or RNA helicase
MSSTGFSQDDLSALVLVNGTIGKTQLIQSVGRILRIMEGKKHPHAIIIFDKQFLSLINEKAPYIVKRNLESEFGQGAIKIKINGI